MDLASEDIVIQMSPKLMVTFQPDKREAEPSPTIETALFLGVRAEPPLEATQLRWQVRLHADDIVQLESGAYLENLGGSLFVTTKEPRVELQANETPSPIGWLKWIGDHGRHSFQIQLAISAVGFDRICNLAGKGKYPDAILTFNEDGPIEHGLSPTGNKKLWKNAAASPAFITEFTLRYDLSRLVYSNA
jgi:hypothetical protein